MSASTPHVTKNKALPGAPAPLFSHDMADFQLELPDEKATVRFGAGFASLLRPGDVVCLSGPLGAGKTTLARGVIAALTSGEEASSPTFALVETYEAGDFALWHFDLYRLEKAEDVWELGLEEAFAEGASLVEWPERIAAHIPPTGLLLRLEPSGEGRRLTARGDEDWARRLEGAGLFQRRESLNKNEE